MTFLDIFYFHYLIFIILFSLSYLHYLSFSLSFLINFLIKDLLDALICLLHDFCIHVHLSHNLSFVFISQGRHSSNCIYPSNNNYGKWVVSYMSDNFIFIIFLSKNYPAEQVFLPLSWKKIWINRNLTSLVVSYVKNYHLQRKILFWGEKEIDIKTSNFGLT